MYIVKICYRSSKYVFTNVVLPPFKPQTLFGHLHVYFILSGTTLASTSFYYLTFPLYYFSPVPSTKSEKRGTFVLGGVSPGWRTKNNGSTSEKLGTLTFVDKYLN